MSRPRASGKSGKRVAQVLELELAALGDGERVRERLGQVGEALARSRRGECRWRSALGRSRRPASSSFAPCAMQVNASSRRLPDGCAWRTSPVASGAMPVASEPPVRALLVRIAVAPDLAEGVARRRRSRRTGLASAGSRTTATSPSAKRAQLLQVTRQCGFSTPRVAEREQATQIAVARAVLHRAASRARRRAADRSSAAASPRRAASRARRDRAHAALRARPGGSAAGRTRRARRPARAPRARAPPRARAGPRARSSLRGS